MPAQIQRAASIVTLVLSLLALLAGCQAPTNDERRVSFLANQQLLTGDVQKVEKAVYHILSVDTDFESIRIEPTTGKFTCRFGTDRRFRQGLCVGIEGSGYVLTAGHCVGNFCYVIGDFEGKIGCQRARVVYRPPAGTQGSDYAILKVESPVNWLPYSKTVTRDEVVFAVGFVQGGEIGGGLDFASGRVKDIQPDPTGTLAKLIDTSVPLRAGDSGGPLFNAAGELVGITQGWQLEVHGLSGKYLRLTCRPDWQILKQLIEGKRQAPERAFLPSAILRKKQENTDLTEYDL